MNWPKFWIAWCAFFFLFDVVAGIQHISEGAWGWAIYEFAFAVIMALLLWYWVGDYRRKLRQRAWGQSLRRF